MRAEGSQTKAHPVLKKLVTKKELVEFYDTTETDFKVQLKSLAKGYTKSSGTRKFEIEGEQVSQVLDEKVRQIQTKSKSAKADKKKSKKAATKPKTGTNRLQVIEKENLLNLGSDEDLAGFEELGDVIDSEEELRMNNGDDMGMAEEGVDMSAADSDDSENIDFDQVQKKMKSAEAPGKSNGAPVIQDKLGAQMYYDS